MTVTRMLCLTILSVGSNWSASDRDTPAGVESDWGEFLHGGQRLLSPSGAEVFPLWRTSLMSSLLSVAVAPHDIIQTPVLQTPDITYRNILSACPVWSDSSPLACWKYEGVRINFQEFSKIYAENMCFCLKNNSKSNKITPQKPWPFKSSFVEIQIVLHWTVLVHVPPRVLVFRPSNNPKLTVVSGMFSAPSSSVSTMPWKSWLSGCLWGFFTLRLRWSASRGNLYWQWRAWDRSPEPAIRH